uniref:HNH endonuclease n=1 Tax=Pithovirus LCPAC401 TaxID=2506595 RepID=A0A481ZAY9_9VIRU|nr:MAG: HNH endonuclease [Pithovirus LCPAC401]
MWLGNKYKFSRYTISSFGRIYNIVTNDYLKGNITSRGYHNFGLISDENKYINRGSHTLIGAAFCGLELIYGDEIMTITMDHINKDKLDNRLCCNLRPVTREEQAHNRNYKHNKRGKTVLAIGKYGEIVREYVSIVLTARDFGVYKTSILNWIKNGKEIKGVTLRYLDEKDLPGQVWKSTADLYPHIQPPIEVSDCGYIRRENGTITEGTNNVDYMMIALIDIRIGKHVCFFVHILVWTVFNDKLVPQGFEISHLKCKGSDNRLCNLFLDTHSGNIMTTINKGLNKNCIKIRRYHHDDTYQDYVSIAEATRNNESATSKSISEASSGKRKTAGRCKCGELFTWSRISEPRTTSMNVTLNNPLISRSKPETLTIVKKIPQKIKKIKRLPKYRISIRKHFHDGSYKDYDSVSKASSDNKGLTTTMIYRASNGERKTTGVCKCGKRLVWTRIGIADLNLENTEKNSPTCVKVRKHFHDGTYEDYESVAQASLANEGMTTGMIYQASSRQTSAGICKCGRRFKWKRINDSNIDKESTSVSDINKVTNNENKRERYGRIRVRKHYHNDTHEDFNSLKDAALTGTKLSSSAISRVINGKQKTAGICKCGKRLAWSKL